MRKQQRPQRAREPRIGRRIRAREVRVVEASGEMLGIMPIAQALDKAQEQGLDLVEINPNANPPVCKILDYGKFKYEKSKQQRGTKKPKNEIKEVKFRPKIGEHDLCFKVKHARRFIEDGNRVRLLVQFRGREIVHPETGRAILDRVCQTLEDVASVASSASMEGRNMSMTLQPRPSRG